MYNGILLTRDDQIRQECDQIFVGNPDISIIPTTSLDDLNIKNSSSNFLFILVSELNNDILGQIKRLQEYIPDLALILYNHSLILSDLKDVSEANELKIVVGQNRQKNLLALLDELLQNYWRKIPYEQFDIEIETLSPRMKKALLFLESARITDCNIGRIAKYLNISAGYFSQEFKRETGQSFRKFMQNVLNYYEEIILEKVNLPAKNISRLLGYSELSSFSRSFKKRNGISPTEYKKLVKM
ncbi:MAG: helix-turn-helix domain-containing protein [Calditrichaceae bacterium]